MQDESCYCAVLRKATRRLSARYDAALAPVGINIAQFSLLRTVSRGGRLSLTELARRMELDRSTVGRNVKVLERMGLLRPSASGDLREAAIELDEDGRRTLAAAMPLWAAVQARIAAELGTARTQALLGELEAFAAAD